MENNNIVVENKIKRKYTKKIKPEKEDAPIQIVASKKSIKRKSEVVETYTKAGVKLLIEYFDGINKDDGTSPMDILLSGKKIVFKTKWIIYQTNTKKHGKIMSEKRAMESGATASDDFFDHKKTGKYVKPHFVIMEKKSKNVLYDDESFIDFCDVLGKLS